MKPLALTLGDPAGIGPEITVAAWQANAVDRNFVVIGDFSTVEQACSGTGISVREISDMSDIGRDAICVLNHPLPAGVKPGAPDTSAAPAIIEWIKRGVALVQSGAASGLVTNPINKKLLVDGAGFGFPGHTEFLSHLDGGAEPVMMLSAGSLRVVPLTIHIAINAVPAALSEALIMNRARIVAAAMKENFGLNAPRLAVAGLNPHAGEGGLMGREEIDIIAPALDKLRAEGLTIEGPLSADTMFHAAARQTYDVALCMYHDQALIPVKAIGFDEGVNTTLGLSFVRTSPDHGTAYGIAGKGLAKSSSLEAALEMASTMAPKISTATR